MAETVIEAVLRATDEMSAPTQKAAAAMGELQNAIQTVAEQSGSVSISTKQAQEGISGIGDASEKSVIPHRAAHQALSLVTQQMAHLAGASPVAGSALRIVDSVMFQLAMTGGAVSLAFIGVTAAVVAISTAFSYFHEASKKQNEELDALVKKTNEYIKTLDTLSANQRSVAAAAAGDLQKKMIENKTAIADLEAEIRKTSESLRTVSDAAMMGRDGFESFSMSAAEAKTMTAAATEGSIPRVQALQTRIGALRVEGERLKKEFSDLSAASKGLGASMRDLERVDPFINLSIGLNQVEAGYRRSADQAQNWGKIADEQSKIADGAILQTASLIGEALGQAFMGANDVWKSSLLGLIDLFIDTAMKIVAMAILVNQAITAMLIPGIGIGVGMMALAGLGAIKGIAHAALSPEGVAAKGAAVGTAAGVTGGATGTAARTAGGQAVSSAQQTVTNNISVMLGVQALDLAAISDSQLQNLVYRLGRLLRQGSATGQFSLQAG